MATRRRIGARTGRIARHLVDSRAPMKLALCGVKVGDGISQPPTMWRVLETSDRDEREMQCQRCRALGRDRLADFVIWQGDVA